MPGHRALIFESGRDVLGLGGFLIVCIAGAGIGVNAVLFWRIDRLAGALLVPYLLWVA